MNNKIRLITLFFILLIAFILRLYRIDEPLADWHSWRQVDTAAVARNYVKFGIDLLHPKYDDLSSIASGKDNPQGYRMVEFPIFGLLHASVFGTMPILNFEVTGRVLSIIFSMGTIIFLFLIIEYFSGTLVAFLTAFFYAFLPFNIFYNRVILPEPLIVMTSLAAIYFFIKGTSSIFNFFLSLIMFMIALLLKPFALFLILPPILYLSFNHCLQSKNRIYWIIGLLSYFIIGILPFILWRLWIKQFPEGIPANMWLLNGDNIRFKGAWFYWLFAERLDKLILGYWGIVLFILGILKKTGHKEGWHHYLWLVSILSYLSFVATGNVRHDYYQILIIPVVCLFLARGAAFLITEGDKVFFSKFASYLVLIICFLFMESFGWYQIRDFFNINHPEIVQAGKEVEKLSKEGEKVIAPYGGDTAFLYQTNRKGWPIGGEISQKIKNGALYYVSVSNDQETKELTAKCQTLERSENFIILSLRNCNF